MCDAKMSVNRLYCRCCRNQRNLRNNTSDHFYEEYYQSYLDSSVTFVEDYYCQNPPKRRK